MGGLAVLDIIILIGMSVYAANAAKKKGYPAWPFVLMMIFTWIGFGCGGGIAGMMIEGDEDGEFPLGFIIGYILGAVLACVCTSLLIACLPTRENPDDRDYSARRRRRRSDDDDNDDPRDRRSRRGDRDEDDDDRRPRRYDRDDEDDDRRPRRYDR